MNGAGVQKLLPGVAYLEMARAAVEQASPARPQANILELRNTIWVEPVAFAEQKQISISLRSSNPDRIDYEIYSQQGEQEIVHGRGQAAWSDQPAVARFDIEHLKAQMTRANLEPDSIYAACARMGLLYGPAFQTITAMYRGSNQALAQLTLPDRVTEDSGSYVLHPSLLEGALQAAAVGLIDNDCESSQPRLPFALESLRIISPSSRNMFAWVRYSPGADSNDNAFKLDIDLCDERGNTCVQMRGFSSRMLDNKISVTEAISSLLTTTLWQTQGVEPRASNIVYAEHHLILCELPQVVMKELASLLPQSECLLLHAGEQKSIAERYSEYALACLERLQSIFKRKLQSKVLVRIVAAGHQERALFAGLSALLKTAALENPQLAGQLLLVSADMTAEDLAQMLREEQAHPLDPLVRYEHGVRQVLRWQEITVEPGKPEIPFREDGVYLITGGLGALGLLFAKEILAQTSQAKVVLTGRSVLSGEKQALLDELSTQAGQVSYRQLDLGDLDQVKHLIAAIQSEHGRLHGIIHSAGMIADNFMLKKTAEEFNQVLGPKVMGAYNLDQASGNVELDFFVLFSSIAGALGNPGQADYASANGFMDQLAAHRNAQVMAGERHGRTRSINWPLWQDGGMRIDTATRDLLQQITGMRPMQTATGMQMFYRSLALPYDQTMVIEGVKPRITTYLQRERLFEPASIVDTSASSAYVNAEAEQVVSRDQHQQQLKAILATVLRIQASIIDMDQPFSELGLDSFLGVETITAINKKYGMELSSRS